MNGGNCAIAAVDDAIGDTDGVLPGKLKFGIPGNKVGGLLFWWNLIKKVWTYTSEHLLMIH